MRADSLAPPGTGLLHLQKLTCAFAKARRCGVDDLPACTIDAATDVPTCRLLLQLDDTEHESLQFERCNWGSFARSSNPVQHRSCQASGAPDDTS